MSVDIAPDGDIMLVVGPAKQHIRVHSLLLKLVSNPFSVLLGPNFKEGQELLAASTQSTGSASSGPKEIALPDDDPESMIILCKVIHHQGHLVDATLSPESLLNLAILSDKYDFLDTVRLQFKAWLSHNETTQETNILVHCIAAAYLFDDPVAFAKYTKDIVLHHVGSFFGVRDAKTEHIFPLDFLGKFPPYQTTVH